MAVDWEVPVIQDEEGGSYGFPSPLDPSSEGIITKGYAIEDSNITIEKIDGEIALKDPINGSKKLSELASSSDVTKSYVVAMSIVLG